MVYETVNPSGWYDVGFLIGVISIWGGCHMNCKSAEKKQKEREWEEIGEKVEKKLKRKIRAWAEK